MIGSCLCWFGCTLGDEVDSDRPAYCMFDDDVMADVENRVRQSLKAAQEARRPDVMFIHGVVNLAVRQTTARRAARGFIRSKPATPLVVRADCIQHKTVFIAKIRPKAD